MSLNIYRLPKLVSIIGLSRSSIYNQISENLLPSPISLGSRAVGWPSNEIDLVLDARLKAKSDEEIKALIREIHTKRLNT